MRFESFESHDNLTSFFFFCARLFCFFFLFLVSCSLVSSFLYTGGMNQLELCLRENDRDSYKHHFNLNCGSCNEIKCFWSVWIRKKWPRPSVSEKKMTVWKKLKKNMNIQLINKKKKERKREKIININLQKFDKHSQLSILWTWLFFKINVNV